MIRKAILIISIAGVCLTAVSCGRSKAADSDTVAAESTVEAAEDLETPDLTWYDLRGNVESCTTELSAAVDSQDKALSEMQGSGSSITEVRFSRSGMLTAEKWISLFDNSRYLALNLGLEYDSEGNLKKGADSSVDPPLPVRMVRNAYGEVTELRVGDGNSAADNCFTLQIEWASGKVKATEMRANELVRRMIFRYNADSPGPVAAEFLSDDIEESTTGTEEYEYVAVDDHGNWTERRVTIRTKVKNYESIEGAGGEFLSYRVEKRTIVYYDLKGNKS